MAGAGSICIGSPLLLGTGIIHLTNNLIHLFASGFHFRWWFWGLYLLAGCVFLTQTINVIRYTPFFVAALILFPWQIACGLRIFIVERVLYVLGGDFMPLWLEFILRVASLVLFLIATIFLSYVGVRSIPTLTFVTEWNWNQVWPHLTTFIVSFPSLLCFGFAYGFGVNAAFQSNDLWNVVKRSRSLTLILTDAASVSSGAKITIAHLSDLHLTRTATRPFLKGANLCPTKSFSK